MVGRVSGNNKFFRPCVLSYIASFLIFVLYSIMYLISAILCVFYVYFICVLPLA